MTVFFVQVICILKTSVNSTSALTDFLNKKGCKREPIRDPNLYEVYICLDRMFHSFGRKFASKERISLCKELIFLYNKSAYKKGFTQNTFTLASVQMK